MSTPEPLQMWTIYDHPIEFPTGYLARLWEVHPDGAVATGHTMSGAGDFGLHLMRRFMQQQGFVCLTRNEDEDDPSIVETWF